MRPIPLREIPLREIPGIPLRKFPYTKLVPLTELVTARNRFFAAPWFWVPWSPVNNCTRDTHLEAL